MVLELPKTSPDVFKYRDYPKPTPSFFLLDRYRLGVGGEVKTVSIWTQRSEKTATIDNQYIHTKRRARIEDCRGDKMCVCGGDGDRGAQRPWCVSPAAGTRRR